MNTENTFELQTKPLFAFEQEGTAGAGCPDTSTATTYTTTLSAGCTTG